MHVPVTLIILIAAYYVRRVSCDDQCFNIGEVQVRVNDAGEDYFSCEPSASTSNCCPLGWICLSNGLCEPIPGNTTQNLGLTSLYTGLCTDPLWRNETTCPKICNNNVTFGAHSGNGVVTCGNGTFCCYGEEDAGCCSTSSNVFSLGIATDVTTLTNPSPATIASTTATATATTSTATTSFSRVSPTSAVVFTPVISSTTSASAIGSGVAVASAPVASSTPKAGVNRNVAIGAGLGSGAAVGLVILAGYLFFARRRSMKLFKGPHDVDANIETNAAANQSKDTRAHEIMTEGPSAELAGGNLPVEIGGRYAPRAEMG